MFYLRHDVTRIGSTPDSDLLLDAVDDQQAEIRRNEHDEYVLVSLSPRVATRVNGQVVTEQLLRTGSRIELGDYRMAYFREEYADHGRPYGGRIGGELGFQRAQVRPTYQHRT